MAKRKPKLSEYDKKAEFDECMKSQLAVLQALAIARGIPFFAAFAVKNGKDETEYVNVQVSAMELGLTLKDDQIVRHANVVQGFDTVPFADSTEMVYDTPGKGAI